ncbi:MAG: bifunctional glutamate N-acetyltransferase/amino-acid acetyltransferase ArgJ [Bacteroidetes bacterium]|nr:bifunctional glutamate N-acetyltransferase/amino-acid acetyltransferase ArgJ [Bacteroidota bacterium]
MYQFIENGTITSVKGFQAAGIYCGIKKKKRDLALIYSPVECTVAGTFTLNKVKAAPLLVSQAIIKAGGKVKAILINSGNANACTGEPGHQDALDSQAWVAAELGIDPKEVLVSSTGVIGQRLPMPVLKQGIKDIVPIVSPIGGYDAAEAIMTTDTKDKQFAVEIQTSAGSITIGGICKGSGMIMPNMATMLGFLTTDAVIDNQVIKDLLLEAVTHSFNKITVDGDTSTNDMVVLMANGASGIEVVPGTEVYTEFKSGLMGLTREMAKAIIIDGEGATKFVEVFVSGAHSAEDADKIAKTICNSPLVKTAIHGQDANWGRIISAAGYSGAEFDPAEVSIYFDDLAIFLPNYRIVLDEEEALKRLSKTEMKITINVGHGPFSTTWYTCDFSTEYIHINADYRS